MNSFFSLFICWFTLQVSGLVVSSNDQQLVLQQQKTPDSHYNLWQVETDKNSNESWESLLTGLQRAGADIWSVDVTENRVQVLTHSVQDEGRLLQLDANFKWTRLMDNAEIAQEIHQENEERRQIQMLTGESHSADAWFQDYHRFDEIRQWFQQLSEDYPDLVTFVPSIGKTHEGRDIFAVHVTDKTATRMPKPKIWFQGQIHAREWISGATVQYVTHQLITKFGQQADITTLLQQMEFVIVPCMNPDGYEHSHTSARLWRKNRRDNGRLQGAGVDLNRNYDSHWDQDGGASRMPGSETYKGPYAASEPEVQALTGYFLKQRRVVGAIDFHSFSQLILRPYGHTRDLPPHEDHLRTVGDNMRDLIAKVHGKQYTSVASIGLYPTTGTASDWFYESEKVRERMGQRVYGYTIELRPASSMGAGGFLLSPKEIIPTGEEIFPAIVFFAQYVSENPLVDY